jgi:hypothetical protein
MILVVQFEGDALAEADVYGGVYKGARASASINDATLGNGFWITSIAEI